MVSSSHPTPFHVASEIAKRLNLKKTETRAGTSDWNRHGDVQRLMEACQCNEAEATEALHIARHHTNMQIGKLIVARHHESEWNKRGIWTGSRYIRLTPHGREMSLKMGLLVEDIRIDCAFASEQIRSLETLTLMLEALGAGNIPIERSSALDERDYGDYTGKNKLEMKKLLGDAEYDRVHREWDCPIPHGETIKMVYGRAVPYYKSYIIPALREGKTALLVSHGNAIRALMKYIENIPDDEVKNLEMLFGSVIVYGVDANGQMTSKDVRKLESKEEQMHA